LGDLEAVMTILPRLVVLISTMNALLFSVPVSGQRAPDARVGTLLQSQQLNDVQTIESAVDLEGVQLTSAEIADSAAGDLLWDPRVQSALNRLEVTHAITTRGARDVAVYALVSPSVVLVVTKEELGTGSVMTAEGDILTNYHVVGSHKNVAVIFKPAIEGTAASIDSAVRGEVVRVDQVADLALIRVRELPIAARPVALGSLDLLAVGQDVHAIGHPTGESWTYTRGIISQIRRGFHWKADDALEHKADVIQTQTPISPGSSGGPLLDDAGKLVGVNAFTEKGQGLNFAVAVSDVTRFLQSSRSRYVGVVNSSQTVTTKKPCKGRVLSETRGADPPSAEIHMDVLCTGRENAILVVPDDVNKSSYMLLDSKNSGKANIVFVFKGRSQNIDYALYDTRGAGTPDLIGYFHDGDRKPYRVEPYHETK
jgi:S1-C subfamily serine protease